MWRCDCCYVKWQRRWIANFCRENWCHDQNWLKVPTFWGRAFKPNAPSSAAVDKCPNLTDSVRRSDVDWRLSSHHTVPLVNSFARASRCSSNGALRRRDIVICLKNLLKNCIPVYFKYFVGIPLGLTQLSISSDSKWILVILDVDAALSNYEYPILFTSTNWFLIKVSFYGLMMFMEIHINRWLARGFCTCSRYL